MLSVHSNCIAATWRASLSIYAAVKQTDGQTTDHYTAVAAIVRTPTLPCISCTHDVSIIGAICRLRQDATSSKQQGR